MQYPLGKSVYNVSTAIQNEIFIEMTIPKPSVCQIHGNLMACYKACA